MKLIVDPKKFTKEMERRCHQDPNFFWETIIVAERLIALADDNGEVSIADGITFPNFVSSGAIFFCVSQLFGQVPTYISIYESGKNIKLS